ncbi:MAG: hypothetical protein ACREJB_11965 [Planctomycetaceae bacterium]
MSQLLRTTTVAAAALVVLVATLDAGQPSSLKKGNPDLQSAGPLTFGPEGVLFIGDPQQAALFAIDTGDTSGKPAPVNVQNLGEKVASLLGTDAKQIQIQDVAVNPASGKVYLSVSRGTGPDAQPVLLRVGSSGELEEVSLKDVPFAKTTFQNPPPDRPTGRRNRNQRRESITDLAFRDGQVIVAGLSNEEFASQLRAVPYPFTQDMQVASVEVYHGNHGAFETRSPVRTFTFYEIGGEPHILAAYTCTPLVKFPVSELKPGKKVRGTTVAELGNRNRPLDMFIYQKDGKDFILMANSARGLMKISTEGLDREEGITQPVSDKAGQTYQTIEELQGVVELDRLDKQHAIVLQQTEDGRLNLKTVELP